MPVSLPDEPTFAAFMATRRRTRRWPWLRWFPTLNAPSSIDPEPFDHGGFFERHGLFWAQCGDGSLPLAVLPSGGSRGLFACDGTVLRCLHDDPPRALGELLATEARPLEQAVPSRLAALVAAAMSTNQNEHHVLDSFDALATYDAGFPHFAGLYRVDAREVARCAAAIAPPRVERGDGGGYRDDAAGWTLSFCTVAGWKHQTHRLLAHRVAIDRAFVVRLTRPRVLSRHIFAELPMVRY